MMFDEPGGMPRGTNRGRIGLIAFASWVGWFFAVALVTGELPGPGGYPEPHPMWTEALLGYVTLYVTGRAGKGLFEMRQAAASAQPKPEPTTVKPITISDGTLHAFVMDAARNAIREEVRAGTLVLNAPPPKAGT